jgi:hypothetical protein
MRGRPSGLLPYLTSRVSECVLGVWARQNVHTVFEVELFASGASRLSPLRKVLAAGHQLFHVPRLRAKIVLDHNGFVSVGSRNLGRGCTLTAKSPRHSMTASRPTPWPAEWSPSSSRACPSLRK